MSKIYFIDDDGNARESDISDAGPVTALPAALQNELLARCQDKPMLLGWSASAETYCVSFALSAMLFVFKRIHRMNFNAPFALVHRKLEELANRDTFSGAPEAQQIMMVPDLQSRGTPTATQTFVWEVPKNMGLFLCTAVSMSQTISTAGIAMTLRSFRDGKKQTTAGARSTNTTPVCLIALDLSPERLSDGETWLYRPPFPNIYSDSKLCCGEPSIPFNVLDMEHSFAGLAAEWGSRSWNTDLLQDSDARALPKLIRGDPVTGKALPCVGYDWRRDASRVSDPFMGHIQDQQPGAWFFKHYLAAEAGVTQDLGI